MAEQKLDVRVSESGTATVVSALDKLEKKLGDVETAQKAETAATEKAAATLGQMSKNLADFFDRQSSKMAVIEKAAGLLGKFNLAFELVNKAIKAGEYILNNYILKVESLEPALDGVNKKLATQVDLLRKVANAGSDLARAAGLEQSQLTPGETLAARGLAVRESELREREAKLLEQIEAAQTRAGRQLGAVGGGGSLVFGEDYEKAAADLERVGFALEDIRLKREKLIADAQRRERDGGAGARAPRGAAAVVDSTTAVGQVQAGTEAFTGGLAVQQMGTALTASADLQQQLDSTAASWAEVGEAALQAGADMRRAAAVSVVAAALQGKSIIKALGQVLTAKSQDYFVESLDWGLKAAGFALFGNPAAGAAAAISAGYLAASGVAAGAGALFGGGGGGGGGGRRGGGTAPAPGATGPRPAPDDGGGGPLTVNVTIDGLAISTADTISAGVVQALGHAASTPGMRSRLRRALEVDRR